jgi:hypothetical protein
MFSHQEHPQRSLPQAIEELRDTKVKRGEEKSDKRIEGEQEEEKV